MAFKIHIGDCVYEGCTRKHVPIVVRAGWCDKCNHKHKQEKKKSTGKKLPTYNYRRQKTNEAEMFFEIWSESNQRCFVCDKPITYPIAANFSHVLPKALNKYPKFKLYKPNVQLLCYDLKTPSCHYKWDHTPRSELKGEGWNKMFKLEAELKEEYKLLQQT